MNRQQRRIISVLAVVCPMAYALSAAGQNLDISHLPEDPGARVYWSSAAGNRFAISAWRADMQSAENPDGIPRELLRAILHDIERAYDIFTMPEGGAVDGIATLGLKDHDGWKFNGRILLGIYDFGASNSARGWTTYDGRIRLNLRELRRDWPAGNGSILETVAHELFHNIQYAYSKTSPSWMREMTATWAGHYAVPASTSIVAHQFKFLNRTHHRLRFDRNCAGYFAGSGHPYGTSLFASFLAEHYGPQAVAGIVSAGGSSGFDAVFKSLGCRGVDDKFRAMFDRFAVGTVLLKDAPANCRVQKPAYLRVLATLAEQELKNPVVGVPPQFTDCSRRHTMHYADAFVSPETCFYDDSRGRLLSAGGFETLQTTAPAGLPPNSEMSVCVGDEDRALSVQGLFRYAEPGPWQVRKATYVGASNQRVLRIPKIEQTVGPVRVVFTRYASDMENNASSIVVRRTLAIATPPVLRELKVYQDRLVMHKVWEPQRSDDGLLTGHIARTVMQEKFEARDARVELIFSREVSVRPDRPMCRFNNADLNVAGGQGRTHVAMISAQLMRSAGAARELVVDAMATESKAGKLPLDQDPATPAIAVMPDWIGYERDGPGMKIGLGGVAQISYEKALRKTLSERGYDHDVELISDSQGRYAITGKRAGDASEGLGGPVRLELTLMEYPDEKIAAEALANQPRSRWPAAATIGRFPALMRNPKINVESMRTIPRAGAATNGAGGRLNMIGHRGRHEFTLYLEYLTSEELVKGHLVPLDQKPREGPDEMTEGEIQFYDRRRTILQPEQVQAKLDDLVERMSNEAAAIVRRLDEQMTLADGQ